MFDKMTLYSAHRVPLVGLLLAVGLCSAGRAQSTTDDSTPAATPAPRPRMGLVVPLTAPAAQTASKTGAKKTPAKAGTTSGGKTGTRTGAASGARPAAQLASRPSPYQNVKATAKAQKYYSAVWGVDRLHAAYTSSGNLIRFSYRVLEPKRAAVLGDHENVPELVGIRSNAVLHIPTMEQIGQLRQLSAAQANKEYWMVFSNKGNLVKPGDEVSVIIGKFRADGLIVE
jgi:hypothetical protein